MTEDQAKTKWCPMFRWTASAGEWNSNREGGPSGKTPCCIASGCMMWRDLQGMDACTEDGPGIEWIKQHRAKYGSSLKEAVEAKRSGKPVSGGGYCGLVGKP